MERPSTCWQDDASLASRAPLGEASLRLALERVVELEAAALVEDERRHRRHGATAATVAQRSRGATAGKTTVAKGAVVPATPRRSSMEASAPAWSWHQTRTALTGSMMLVSFCRNVVSAAPRTATAAAPRTAGSPPPLPQKTATARRRRRTSGQLSARRSATRRCGTTSRPGPSSPCGP